MTDDDRPKFDLAETSQLVFDRLGGRGDCPACGKGPWLIEQHPGSWFENNPQPAPAYVMKDPRGFFGSAPAIPTLAFTCIHCGFVRQHNLVWLTMELERLAREEKGE